MTNKIGTSANMGVATMQVTTNSSVSPVKRVPVSEKILSSAALKRSKAPVTIKRAQTLHEDAATWMHLPLWNLHCETLLHLPERTIEIDGKDSDADNRADHKVYE